MANKKYEQQLEALDQLRQDFSSPDAAGSLRKALANPVSVEMSRRLEALVAKLDARELSPERLRALRALRVLEEFDTPETRRILQDFASAPDDLLRQEAAAVLARLARRPSP